MAFAGLTKLLEWNEAHLCPLNKDLTTQRDENGSMPLHFAAAINSVSSWAIKHLWAIIGS